MRTRGFPAALVVATASTLVLLAPVAPVHGAVAGHAREATTVRPFRPTRGGPGTWTKLGKVDSGFDYPGVFRTSDGKLHVVWRKRLQDNNLEFDYTTVALNGVTLNTGSALSDWETLEDDPVLVHDGNGMRLLFKGGIDTGGGFFSRAAVYTLTSSTAGTSWQLPQESVMKQTTLNGGFAGTAEQDDTPVAVASLNNTVYFLEGTDPNAPASAPDGTVSLSSGDYFNQSATTASDDSVWIGYFRAFSNPQSLDGYYVQQILPSKGQPMKAPASHINDKDNEPRQAVAIAARNQGGVYLAYCAPSQTKTCAHVDLWKVGASSPMVVPGTSSGTITRVALADGLAGRISVVTMDPTKETVNAVRTNTNATSFGPVRTIKLPPGQINFNTLEAEGTFGRLDVLANLTTSASPNPIFVWHTQILAGLTLTASPTKFSHVGSHTVTFTVKDAGQPLQGAKVTCIGKSGTTTSSGQVKLTYPNGTAQGKHVCTASHTDYNPGKTTLTVT